MKIVVFGPDRRVGALRDGEVIDLNGAYDQVRPRREGEPLSQAMAAAMAPGQPAAVHRSRPATD